MIEEEGGALTGRGDRLAQSARRRRAHRRRRRGPMAPMLLVGVGINAETFALPATSGPYGGHRS